MIDCFTDFDVLESTMRA